MPRHRVINRRNAVPLVRRSLSLTPEALVAATQLAAQLGVSQGSIIDTALREFTARSPSAVIEALSRHGHLTPTERAVVEEHTKQKTGGQS